MDDSWNHAQPDKPAVLLPGNSSLLYLLDERIAFALPQAILMSTKPSCQKQVTQAVEQKLKHATCDVLQGTLLEGCLRLWRDFAARTDLSRTRKPETWAAALLYTFDRLQLGGFSQEDASALFQVSAISVSQKHRQIAETLGLLLLDARYLAEARRMAVRRDYGKLPEDLPLLETPTGFWHLPFAFREQDTLYKAQDLVYDGWEALSENARRAERCFRKALERDPYLADAYNGLAGVAEARDDLDAAEAHYRKAYELAREMLGSESPKAYYWWGELETRPYMRARQGLGWIHWQTGHYREALVEYEALLRLNPNDNQGVRYVIAPLYQLAEDLEGALKAYQHHDRHHRDDWGDPHHSFCRGLALYAAGRREEAVRRWREALFQNVYLAPLLLNEPLPSTNIWHGTNLQWPDYAEEYLDLYGALWDRAPEAAEVLRRLWHDPEVKADVEHWLAMRRTMQHRREAARSSEPGAQAAWLKLLEEQRAVEQRAPSETTQRRVLAGAS